MSQCEAFVFGRVRAFGALVTVWLGLRASVDLAVQCCLFWFCCVDRF